MKFLFKITRGKTETLLNGVDFDIVGFDLVFKDGIKIKFGDLNDVIVRNGEYVIYTNDNNTLKYARKIIEALYK